MLDLETMQFEAGPTMEMAHGGAAATPLDANRILVIGGSDKVTTATTEILGATDD